MAEVFERMNLLESKSVRNEAEVRYAVCNPLISMVCECFGYSLKLEETVKENLEETEEVEDVREEAVLVDLRTLWDEHPTVETPMERDSHGEPFLNLNCRRDSHGPGQWETQHRGCHVPKKQGRLFNLYAGRS